MKGIFGVGGMGLIQLPDRVRLGGMRLGWGRCVMSLGLVGMRMECQMDEIRYGRDGVSLL